MNPRAIAFLVITAAFVVALILAAFYYYRRGRQTTDSNWDELLSRLTAMDRSGVAEIALNYADESGRRRTDSEVPDMESSDVWELIGGLQGLENIEKNCAVLIDLAFYIQQWYPEAIVLAEELRLSAREVEWHVERLRGAANAGHLETSFGDYAPPAITKYYFMTQHVLALYERVQFPMLAQLQRAI